MKRLFAGKDNKMKRRISAIMAGVVTLTTIGGITFFKQEKVEAKETLYSIDKLINNLEKNDETYSILEIVPDTVSGNIPDIEDVSGNKVSLSFNQQMGFVGYYVGGSEPVRKDVDTLVGGQVTLSANGMSPYVTTLSDSSLRYNAVNKVYEKIKDSDIYNPNNGPFSLEEGYKEIRQGEYVKNGTIGSVISDNELENGYKVIEGSEARIDMARGTMEWASPFEPKHDNAHYILTYIGNNTNSSSASLLDSSRDDIAAKMLEDYEAFSIENELSANKLEPYDLDPYFGVASEGQGGFDPYLTNDPTSGKSINAIFEDVYSGDNAKYPITSGYRVVDHIEVKEDSVFAPDTPLYTYNKETGRFEDAKMSFAEWKEDQSNSSSGGGDENPGGNENGGSGETTETEIPSVDNENSNSTDNDDARISKGILVSVIRHENKPALSNIDISIDADIISVDDEDTVVTNDNSVKIEDSVAEENDVTVDSYINSDNGNDDSVVIGEPSESVTLDIDNVDNDDNEDPEIIGGSETPPNTPEDIEGDYFVLKFKYFANYQKSSVSDYDFGFYSIKSFWYTEEDATEHYSIAPGTLVPNLVNKGTIYLKNDVPADYFVYKYDNDSSKCNYVWSGDETSKDYYRITGSRIYYSYGIENKEWFKRFVFDRDSAKYDQVSPDKDTAEKLKLKVEVKTANEVTLEDITGKSKGYYKNKLITLMSGDASYCIGGESDYAEYSAKNKDINSDVYTAIINRVCESDARMPIIVDNMIIEKEWALQFDQRDSLMYNLAYALNMEELSDYSYHITDESNNIFSGELANTTFSPADYAVNNSIEILNYNNGDYVHGNIYMYNRRNKVDNTLMLNLLNLTFNEEFDSAIIENGFGEVRLDIENEKEFRAADVSLSDNLSNDKVTEATTIRYIIGYGDKRVSETKGEISVLELEPVACFDLVAETVDVTNDYKDSSGSIKEEYKDLIYEETEAKLDDSGNIVKNTKQYIYSSKLYYKDKNDNDPNKYLIGTKEKGQAGLKINLKQMTTAEFVGRIEDLNSTYDLIYIGMNTGVTYTGAIVNERVWSSPLGGYNSWGRYDPNQWPTDQQTAGWTGKNWEYKNSSNQNHYYEAWDGDYFCRGWRSREGDGPNTFNWWKTYYYYVEVYHDVDHRQITDAYGGFHHRLSTQTDVNQKRANKPDTVITDFNDDNMDGLVYSNVGDMVYLTERAGGSLKILKEGVKGEDSAVYTWPEYVGEEKYDNKENEKLHRESDTKQVKGYDYISITNDANLGYSRDENGNKRSGDVYSLYRTRYSGNDITEKNKDALVDFVRAGYPVILADGFYSEYNETTRKGTINECTVDNSSYMYQMATTINNESSEKNVFVQSHIPANMFEFYVMKVGKPTIKMTDDKCLVAQSSTVYLDDSDRTGTGHYNAYYRFKIDNKGTASAGATYNIGLYIDINADGKYSQKNEGIAFSTLKDFDTMNSISPVSYDPETRMPIYELAPGHEYEATCKLSSSFVGCLPWRISVVQNGNKYRRSNADGYYAIRNDEKMVRVLQIVDNGNEYFGSAATGENRQTRTDIWDMEKDYKKQYNNSARFYNLITDTAYMPFNVVGDKIDPDGGDDISNYNKGPNSMSITEFRNVVTRVNNPTKEQEEQYVNKYYEYLRDNYDMVILGFVDCYVGLDTIATKAIKKYIENGYSVLFTHDCTSFVNSRNRYAKRSNAGWWEDDSYSLRDWMTWGYEFNSIVRNIVGMDRYDVMAESTHENEKAYKPRSNRKLELDYESHGYSYLILNNNGYHSTDSRISNHNDERTNYMAEGMNDRVMTDAASKLFKYSNYVGASLGGGQYDSGTYVSSVNKGQITQYPYVLKESFQVAKTHAQYYQLDLTADDDHDDESDIVVWYCISTVGSSNRGGIDTAKMNMYNVSPNDVRNNYYIYNKGNVTYSGVGHSRPTGEDEYKLFINSMVAAYRSGLHEPELAILEGFGANAQSSRQLYVSYDDQIRKSIEGHREGDINELNNGRTDGTQINKNSDIDNSVDMYFSAEQVSLVQNASSIDHNLYAKVYLADDSASGVPLKELLGDPADDQEKYLNAAYQNIKVKPLDLTGIVTASDGTVLTPESGHTDSEIDGVPVNEAFMNGSVKVANGVTYKVKVPVTDDDMWGGTSLSYNGVKQTRRVYVVVRDYAKYTNQSNEVYKTTPTNWGVKSIDISRVEVFDLD